MNKKVTLGFLLSFFIAGSAYSQDVAFGLKGGLNLSSLDLKDAEATYNSRTGFHAGIFLRGKFDKIGVQPELLLFTQRGEMVSDITGTSQESFTYLSVPFLLKFYPIGGLNIHAGPQFGFLIDGEREYNTLLGRGSSDIKDYYKKSDVALSLGAGYDFGFGLSFDVRYNVGVKDINNAADGDEVKSKVIMVGLGWNFAR